MKRNGIVWLVCGCVALAGMRATAAAPAEAEAGGVGVTAKVGTLGVGGELTLGLNDYVGIRLGVNAFNWSGTTDAEEGTVYTDLDWLTYGGLLDLHLFGGGFRVSGGALVNKNKLNLRADLTEPVELNGQKYWLEDLKGDVTFDELAPYVGIGYGNAVDRDGRWHFSCDFGVMLQGEPKVSATATASNPAIQPAVDAALQEEVADIQDDAKSYKYYPVVSLGVSFRF